MKHLILFPALSAFLWCIMHTKRRLSPACAAPAGVAPVTAAFGYAGEGIRLTLPADWDYSITAHDAEIGQFSISVWPHAQPQAQLELVHYGDPFGVCGDGLTTRSVAFSNGRTGSMGTYNTQENWSYIAFDHDYVALNQGIGHWWDTYGTQAMGILGSAVLGKEAAC